MGLGFINENRSILIYIALGVFLWVCYRLVKRLPTKAPEKKSKKVEQKTESVEEKSSKEPESAEQKIEKTEVVEEPKKESKKPSVTRVYVREPKQDTQNGELETRQPDKYDRDVEFVNTSSNIAKFKSFAETETVPDLDIQESEMIDDIDEADKNEVKYFDRSRRLSNAIKNNDFENMFSTHISDTYSNFDCDRHLNLSEGFEERLFKMANRTIENGRKKLKCTEDESCPIHEDHYSNYEDNDVSIDSKSILLIDSIMHRKSIKR